MMRQRRKRHSAIYPKWSHGSKNSPAFQCKMRANWQCEECQVKNRSIATNPQGELYIVYLHAAHVHPLDPVRPELIEDQALRSLCPQHHARYDQYWRARAAEADHQRNLHAILIGRFVTRAFVMQRFLTVC